MESERHLLSQADSFAVVPEPRAKLSAWERCGSTQIPSRDVQPVQLFAHSSPVGRGFRALAIHGIEADELASFAEAPERILDDPSATLIKRGRSALVVHVALTISGTAIQTAYKRCGSRTQLRRLVRGIRTSAARRNFLLGHQLLSLGIATPRPVLAVFPRWHNLLSPSFLATEWIEGALPLDAFTRTAVAWGSARRRAALRETARQLGRLIGTLHKHGYSHRDLKSANLLVREINGEIEVFLVDLDGASRPRFRIDAARLKNLARLQEASSQITAVTSTLRCRFLNAYLRTLGRHEAWKTIWRRLQKTSRIPPRPVGGRVDAH